MIEPPPIPTVRESSVFRKVLWPPTLALFTMALPLWITEISVLVPPTSRKMPSETLAYIKAAAIPAAGPDKKRQDGALSHLADVHNAAVAAHDHQRRRDAAALNAFVCHVSRLCHFGQDAGVDYGRSGSHLQAVQLAYLMAGSRRQAQPLGGARHGIFAARVVHAEGLAGHDDAAALAAQRLHCAADAPRP